MGDFFAPWWWGNLTKLVRFDAENGYLAPYVSCSTLMTKRRNR